jgi:hypothetical protein
LKWFPEKTNEENEGRNMNWITLLLRALQLAPVIVAGIEHIHGEAPGATKKQLAMDALQLAYGGASALLPGDQAAIDAAAQLTSNTIDGVVSVFNAAGVFAKRGSAPAKVTPLPAAAPVAAPVPAARAPIAAAEFVNHD